jgi:hypothetical protein
MMNDSKRWAEFFFLSAAIHVIILFLLLDNKLDYKHTLGLDTSEEKQVEVSLVDGDQYRQIVGIDDDYKGDKEENDRARYLGKVNRFVDRETQANLWGKPKNRNPKVQYIIEEELQNAIGSYLNKKNSREQNKKTSGDDYGDSTNYDYLPGVASGDYTILNTAEFVYFSFYKRVEDAVVYLWNRHVSDFIKSRPDVRENLGKKDYITEVDAVLDKEGNFIRIAVVRSSGVAGIDEAPGKAFMEASPFEHPPDGMISADGLVRMRWRFMVSVVENLKFNIQEIDPNNYSGRPDRALERQMR